MEEELQMLYDALLALAVLALILLPQYCLSSNYKRV